MRFAAKLTGAVALSALWAGSLVAQDVGQVLARVGAVEITLGHAIALREQLPPQFQMIPADTLFPAIVDQLIEQELLAQSMAGMLANRDRLMLENEERNFIANIALTQVAEAALTEAALETAYAAFAAEFAQGEPAREYNAAHILVRTQEEIETIAAEIAGGRDFGDAAREYSLDGSGQSGGNLGWFGEGVMIQPFEDMVLSLEPGQVSAPVETRFGWHLILLNETRLAAVPPLDDVREELEQQIQREAARAHLDSLRAGAEVTRDIEGVDPALVARTDLID
jgi:peptidyl-prolyl cis-trans isomerase C